MIIDWTNKTRFLSAYHNDNVSVWQGVESIVAESLLALKSLVLEIASGLGMTLMPNGNTLPISIVTQTPTAAPSGNKGVVFKVSGGVLTIYAWNGSSWIAN